MTDQVAAVTGQPEPAAQPVTVMTAPAAPPVEPAPAQPTPTAIPEKYSGKTLEQLAQEMEEKDSYIAQVNERAARAEHESILTRNLVEQLARDKGKPQESQIAEPEFSDDAYLTNPVKVTSAILDKKLERYFAQDRKEREQEKIAQTITQVKSAFDRGLSAAVKSNPALFKGIESQISQGMIDSVRMSLSNGAIPDLRELEDPTYFESAALAYRRYKMKEDLSKYFVKQPTTPVAPVHTEVPSPGGAPQGAVTLTQEQEMAARAAGFTREQFAEMWGKTQAEKARRAQ